MSMKRSLMLVVVFIVYSSMARADNFRCPNGSIVSTGDSISEVIVKCDPPTNKVKRIEGEGRRVRYVEVEEWTYNEGLNTLVHYLLFRDGVLVEVRTGTFGR
jgi:hypothetical protein